MRLTQFRRKRLLLDFYPRADTPRSAAGACGIPNGFPQDERCGAIVLGFSLAAIGGQARSGSNHPPGFPLPADLECKTYKAREASGSKPVKRSKTTSVRRTTSVIDEGSRIRRVFRDVRRRGRGAKTAAALD